MFLRKRVIENSERFIRSRYIEHPSGENVTKEFLRSGNYEIEAMGKLYKADLYLQSPFDPQNKRLMGIYRNESSC